MGQLPGTAQQPFGDILSDVGGTPTDFTNIDMDIAGLTPQRLTELVNAMYGDAAAKTANQQRNIVQQGAPGTGAVGAASALLGGLGGALGGGAAGALGGLIGSGGGFLGTATGDLMAQAQRANDAIAARNETMLRGQIAPEQNLRAMVAQTGVERARSQDDLARRGMAVQYGQYQDQNRLGLLNQIQGLAGPQPFSKEYAWSTASGYPAKGLLAYGPPRRA
jgi:hypothetical protein